MLDELQLDPYGDFPAASRAALGLLQSQLGMGLWMVTRTAGEDWLVLGARSQDPRYAVREGDNFRWEDSVCHRMVSGNGPRLALDVEQVAAYRDAPIRAQLPVAAYVGIPLRLAGGELFGTLCAVDASPRAALPAAQAELLEVTGRLLSTLLDRELKLSAESRRAEQAESVAMVDELTGLWNRRAWERFRAAEEQRCLRYGHPACVLSVDLDGLKQVNDTQGHDAGDALLKRGAQALRSGSRPQDVVARLGGDEFALLLVECTEPQGRGVVKRLHESLAQAGVEASIGLARREPPRGLDDAWTRADQEMYAQKRARKQQRAGAR